MPIQKILQALANYKKASKIERRTYLNAFEEKMIYRTTKTENPQTTAKMVRHILDKLKRA